MKDILQTNSLYIGYGEETATVTVLTDNVDKIVSLRGKLAAMLDSICGVRRIALAVENCRLLTVYTVDGNTAYDRLGNGNCWIRQEENSIIWKNIATGQRAIQLMV